MLKFVSHLGALIYGKTLPRPESAIRARKRTIEIVAYLREWAASTETFPFLYGRAFSFSVNFQLVSERGTRKDRLIVSIVP